MMVGHLIDMLSGDVARQLGRSFHPGLGTGFWMQGTAMGRWGAASRAYSSAVACWGECLGKGVVQQPDPAPGIGLELVCLRVARCGARVNG